MTNIIFSNRMMAKTRRQSCCQTLAPRLLGIYCMLPSHECFIVVMGELHHGTQFYVIKGIGGTLASQGREQR